MKDYGIKLFYLYSSFIYPMSLYHLLCFFVWFISHFRGLSVLVFSTFWAVFAWGGLYIRGLLLALLQHVLPFVTGYSVKTKHTETTYNSFDVYEKVLYVVDSMRSFYCPPTRTPREFCWARLQLIQCRTKIPDRPLTKRKRSNDRLRKKTEWINHIQFYKNF